MDRQALLNHHIYCPQCIDIKDINLHLYMGYFILVHDKYYGVTLFQYDQNCSVDFVYSIRALTDYDLTKIPDDAKYIHNSIYRECLSTKVRKFVSIGS